MKNELLDKGIILPGKDKISLVAGAVMQLFSEMVWVFWSMRCPIQLVTLRRKSCWTISGLSLRGCLKMSRKSYISSMVNGLGLV